MELRACELAAVVWPLWSLCIPWILEKHMELPSLSRALDNSPVPLLSCVRGAVLHLSGEDTEAQDSEKTGPASPPLPCGSEGGAGAGPADRLRVPAEPSLAIMTVSPSGRAVWDGDAGGTEEGSPWEWPPLSEQHQLSPRFGESARCWGPCSLPAPSARRRAKSRPQRG